MEQQAEHSPGRAALLTRRSDILRQVRRYSASADLDQNRTFKRCIQSGLEMLVRRRGPVERCRDGYCIDPEKVCPK
jgi:hypothetical protein